MKSLRHPPPRHRSRATARRRRRVRTVGTACAGVIGVVLGAHAAGLSPPASVSKQAGAATHQQGAAGLTGPARLTTQSGQAAAFVVPTGGPTVAALTISSPPVTLDFERMAVDPRPPGPPPGLPLPMQYLQGGSIDQGVDYLAPGGTPLYAVGPGIIIQEGGPGTSGFGPNIPVLQITGGPLAGKTVYYGHAGPDVVPAGTVVSEGQQISVVGYGRVGISSAPHLEIGFWPLGGMRSGRAMMDYLDQLMGTQTGRH